MRRGGERVTRDLADGLLERGHRPRLITSHPGLPSRRCEDGLPILRLPRPPQGLLLRRRYEAYLTHVPLSYAALRAGRYDVVHAMHAPDALAAARWRRRSGRPALLTYMGIPDHAGLMERRLRLECATAAIEGCDAVVAISRYAAAAFERWLGYPAAVIEPGVDVRAFRPAAQRAAVPTIVSSADATEPRKHVGLLIDAFALLRDELPEARLVLSRPARGAVPPAVPGVEWANLDDRATLARAYGGAWAAALPSSAEAFGLAALEPMACGTPVAAYDGGGLPEVVDRPGVGVLFETLDAVTLAGALRRTLALAEDPGTAARCRARAEELSTERATERYLALYRELGAAR